MSGLFQSNQRRHKSRRTNPFPDLSKRPVGTLLSTDVLQMAILLRKLPQVTGDLETCTSHEENLQIHDHTFFA